MMPLRRKSHGSIRSPHVKRNIHSHVVIEDWLFKLEGGALKQFKKRWCVLSDFCLFFYKAPNGKETISSILLPSYRINPCTSDDKITRKFAFKVEHQNMKTYYFATDDEDSMKRWMNAMVLASIMHNLGPDNNYFKNPNTTNADDESGFSCYRSKRSIPNDSHADQLKPQSSSYGEVFLGSDAKYPTSNYNNNNTSHLYRNPNEIPRRQPMYANAPPKPRRLTISEYQYDQPLEPTSYSERPVDVHAEHRMAMNYSAIDPHMQYGVPATHSNQMQYVEAYEKEESESDFYRSQPPRPRSAADFLERDPECPAIPDVAQYPENPQPQRPKSSMDYYNRLMESEDGNFDDYREAVRIQADNLYSNKNLLGLKKQQPNHSLGKENASVQDPRVNIHYVGSSNDHLTQEEISPCYAMPSKVLSASRYNRHDQSSTKQTSQSRPSEQPMQRLLEWKQRMLQSPLSKRNHPHSSSNTSSPLPSHLKASSNQYQASAEMGSREAHMQRYNPANQSSYQQAPSHYPVQMSPNKLYDHQSQNLDSPASMFPTASEVVSDTSDYSQPKKNMLYCVDSENNEILFSYDNSPITQATSSSLQTCHYPPQMHSFSTMPNVSSIGSEIPDMKCKAQENSSYSGRSGSSIQIGLRSHDHPGPNHSDLGVNKHTTYSSDDEASLDSEYLPRNFAHKGKLPDLSRSLSSEIHNKELNRAKKLVHQSEGLMCKGKRLSVSAGDLLGKTHEELVLLLIQLRRNQTKLLRSKEKLECQLHLQSQMKQPSHHSSRELQKQIQLLEQQVDVTQPLITLVDNMVKLGSLYGSSNRRSFSLPVLDKAQEEISASSSLAKDSEYFGSSSILSKLLAEETSLQKCISEIHTLDKGLRHETNSISSLHQDKEMLEYTLSGMRNKILDHQDRPSELQKLKKQQRMIEKELTRVKRLLSTSAKKIEDAASKNDQMEKDILHLRHILKEALKSGSAETKTSSHSRADLEAELSRVQNVLDELANHRHEINNTVEKLTGESHHSFFQVPDLRASPVVSSAEEREEKHLKQVKKGVEVRASPTGVAGSAPLPSRKKQHSMYLETDLDTMVTIDLAVAQEKDFDDIPVYANAEELSSASEECYKSMPLAEAASNFSYTQAEEEVSSEQCAMQDINEADERMKRFYGIIPKEKPSEIKTVRIVKRQSERRNRDKKRVTYDDQSSVWVVEEPDLSSDDLLDFDEGPSQENTTPAVRPSSINLQSPNLSRQPKSQSAHERLFGSGSSLSSVRTERKEKLPGKSNSERSYNTKRTKRRHYTVSGYQYILDPQFSQYFKDRPRSRDDVDMERCLRTANTPDIVRSTIKKNEVFDDKIIERELMLPSKIEIPERYVEDEPEELSASEKLQRSRKAENICKMLSETTGTYADGVEERSKSPDALQKKLNEEKRKRAHLLNLNRAIAREVVEKSKAVAANITENQAS